MAQGFAEAALNSPGAKEAIFQRAAEFTFVGDSLATVHLRPSHPAAIPVEYGSRVADVGQCSKSLPGPPRRIIAAVPLGSHMLEEGLLP